MQSREPILLFRMYTAVDKMLRGNKSIDSPDTYARILSEIKKYEDQVNLQKSQLDSADYEIFRILHNMLIYKLNINAKELHPQSAPVAEAPELAGAQTSRLGALRKAALEDKQKQLENESKGKEDVFSENASLGAKESNISNQVLELLEDQKNELTDIDKQLSSAEVVGIEEVTKIGERLHLLIEQAADMSTKLTDELRQTPASNADNKAKLEKIKRKLEKHLSALLITGDGISEALNTLNNRKKPSEDQADKSSTPPISNAQQDQANVGALDEDEDEDEGKTDTSSEVLSPSHEATANVKAVNVADPNAGRAPGTGAPIVSPTQPAPSTSPFNSASSRRASGAATESRSSNPSTSVLGATDDDAAINAMLKNVKAASLKEADTLLMIAKRLRMDMQNTYVKAPATSFLRTLIISPTDGEAYWRDETVRRAEALVNGCKQVKNRIATTPPVDIAALTEDTLKAFYQGNAAETNRREKSSSNANHKASEISVEQQKVVYEKELKDKSLSRVETLAKLLLSDAMSLRGSHSNEEFFINLEYEAKKIRKDMADYKKVLEHAQNPDNEDGDVYKTVIGETAFGKYQLIEANLAKIDEIISKLKEVADLVKKRRNQPEELRAHFQVYYIEEPVELFDLSDLSDISKCTNGKAKFEAQLCDWVGGENTTGDMPHNNASDCAVLRGEDEDKNTTKDFFGPKIQFVRAKISCPDGKEVRVGIKVQVNEDRTCCKQTLTTAKLSQLADGTENALLEFALALIERGKASVIEGPVIIPNIMPKKVAQAIADMCVYLGEKFQANEDVTKNASDKRIIKLWENDPSKPRGVKERAELDEVTQNITSPTPSSRGLSRGG